MACTKCLECNGSIIKGRPFPFLLNPAVWVQISTWPLQGCVTLGKLLSHSVSVSFVETASGIVVRIKQIKICKMPGTVPGIRKAL